MNDQPPSMPETKNTLSITSLVLGILAIVPCSIFTGIPAVVTGHIALSQAKRSPTEYGGRGMAVAGLVMGYLSILVAVFMIPAALLLPALAKAKARAQEVQCRNQLRSISLAARLYSNDHAEKFAPDFLSMSNELNTPKILVCPSDRNATKTTNWESFGSANSSYEFLVPGADQSKIDPKTPAFRCPVHGTVAFADGSADTPQRSSRRKL